MTAATEDNSVRDHALEQQITAYLAAHPDFFEGREALVTELRLPHPATGKTVSLVERQVALLREQKLELKHKLQHLAQVARGNEQLLERLERLILELVDCDGDMAVKNVLETALRRDFHADAVAVWLFGPGHMDVGDPRLVPFQRVTEQCRPVCGTLRAEQIAALFGEGAPDVASGALIPLCEAEGDCLGLVGVGSIDPKRYHPEMGTVFLRHVGAVTARVLRRVRR